MLILADTCSVLMLLRIAPDMFSDPQYECVTTTEVFRELKSNQKFRTKYPWIRSLIPSIKCIGNSELETEDYNTALLTIESLLSTNPINEKTQKVFDLSRVDKHIIACAAAQNLSITTGETDIVDFAIQEFNIKSYSALGVLNIWLKKGLVACDENLLAIIDDWEQSREAGQPTADIEKFQKLTKKFYLGPAKRSKHKKSRKKGK